MEINLIILQKYLEGLNDFDYSNLNEYQNKYYLAKKIQEKFPEINDVIVYDAIDQTNLNSEKTFLTKKYIIELSKNLLSFFTKQP